MLKNKGLIEKFAEHKLAANMLMVLILLAGGLSLFRLNTQFLPKFGVNTITIRTIWPGAAPDDVERSVTEPIEEKLREVDHIKEISSASAEGYSFIVIEFKEEANVSDALQQVRNQISLVRSLPQDIENPEVNQVVIYDPIARVVISSTDDHAQLRHWAYQFERELLDRGIAKVSIQGLQEQEVSINLTPHQLAELRVSLNTFSQQVNQQSQDISAGVVGRNEGGRRLRSLGQRREAHEFEYLPIVRGDKQRLLHLVDLASVEKTSREYSPAVFHKGKNAIDLTLLRTQNQDALDVAKILHQWVKEVSPTLPKSMSIHVYNEIWQLIKERINLLVNNGLGGLVLILILLFLAFNARVAFWVGVSIPISIAATLFFLKISGFSINMVTLFAIIMSLGIIVDDTIVVGEEGVSQFERGEPPLRAVILGAKRMLIPVFSSSLTTLAAFLPLLMLGGIYGQILISIPAVVICIIIASLIEAFLILPSHLKVSFTHLAPQVKKPYRLALERSFYQLRDVYFRRFVTKAIKNHWVTLSVALSLVIVTFGLVLSGRPQFNFFPTPDGKLVFADATFFPGTSEEKMDAYLKDLEKAAWRANEKLKTPNRDLVKTVVRFRHLATNPYEVRSAKRVGSLIVELISPEYRRLTNADFVKVLRQEAADVPSLEELRISAPRGGPPGADIDIVIAGAPPETLKKAAVDLHQQLLAYPGVFNVSDNLPYAPEELVFSLKPEALHAGLTMDEIGRQLRAAYTGDLMQIFHQGKDEIEVRVKLSKAERDQLGSIEKLPIMLLSGNLIPLGSLVDITTRKSFNSFQHTNFQLAVNVGADVDTNVGNTNQILNDLKTSFLPNLANRYGVNFSFKGRTRDQEITLKEMQYALIFAVGLIYIILAWVSSSYLWPIFVMLAIPFGLVGAIFGHFLMGLNLTLLSLFGLFGLSGIVVNDSIILLFRFKELKEQGMQGDAAVIEACVQRFRPVVLTSLTTIAGLSPILFERSLQAQFLIPMATSICFGLAVATLLILVVVPTLFSMTEARKGNSGGGEKSSKLLS